MQIDQNLILGCISQERVAQKQLYELLLPYLAVVCRRYLINEEDVNDALQESFINLFRFIASYDDSRSEFKTWAVRITINCSIKLNKRLPTLEMNGYDEVEWEDSHIPCVLDKLSNEDLIEVLRKMPREYFEVFNLNIIDGYSHREISELLGIHEDLSRQRLARARKCVSSRITEEGEAIVNVKRTS